jgi:hypothetical protein
MVDPATAVSGAISDAVTATTSITREARTVRSWFAT